MKFAYQDAGVSAEVIARNLSALKEEIAQVQMASTDSVYTTPQSCCYLPYDEDYLHKIEQAINETKKLQPTLLIVVGIGGSSLGTLAVHEALGLARGTIKLYAADTLDAAATPDLMQCMEAELRAGGRVLLVIISKSGKTTETLVNAALLYELLIQYHPQGYRDFIRCITDEGSPLWRLAQKEGYGVLGVPKSVGGRFSVLSAVGLFPLGVLGIEIRQLLAGAREALALELPQGSDRHPAYKAAVLYEQYHAGRAMHTLFIFTRRLAGLGAWYRQLMGESLGKKYNLSGQEVQVGMVPTVAMGTQDLHSMVQLYLAGPQNVMTTFIADTFVGQQVGIPRTPFAEIDPVGVGKTVATVKEAILGGTQEAYRQAGRPFSTMLFDGVTAHEIGFYLQWSMLEIIYFGALLQVNVFDQPEVELYKRATRELLR